MDHLVFAWPAVLLLLPLPFVSERVFRPRASGRQLRLPSLAPYIPLSGSPALGMRWQLWVVWGLLLVAAARPQQPDLSTPLPVSGRSLMLALDLSASMATRDMKLDGLARERLEVARGLADDFIAHRQGDRMGLIVFGKQAYVHVPPTLDLQAVRDALNGSEVGLAGAETALGDAIALATKQLRIQPDAARVLVLLTDGASTAGTLEPARAAWVAQREGVRIHAVGIGGEPTQRKAFDLDEASLQQVTSQTGGFYRRAADGAALREFFHHLDAQEVLPDRDKTRRPLRELAVFPLSLALLLLAWESRRRHSGADFFSQAVDAALRPHVVVETKSNVWRARIFWGLAAMTWLATTLWWLVPPGSVRPADLHVLIADLSSAELAARARAQAAALLERMPPGESALIVYAGDAYLAMPPTRDPDNIRLLLPEFATDIMPHPGQRPERAQVLLVKIQERHGQGRTIPLWLPDTALEARKFDDARWIPENSFPPTLLTALLLALLPLTLLHLRGAAAAGLATILLASLLFTPQPAIAGNDDAAWEAVAHYRVGRYAEAMRLLMARDDAVSHYNRGNALALMGRYAEAEAAYGAALDKRPDDADAQFNRELMRRLQGVPPAGRGAGKGSPPPPEARTQLEASRVAGQWLQGVPDDPGGLLRARLRREHERRQARLP